MSVKIYESLYSTDRAKNKSTGRNKSSSRNEPDFSKVIVYDYGDDTLDRFTVIIGSDVYAMSYGAIGYNEHVGELGYKINLGTHLGNRLDGVPEHLKWAVKDRMYTESVSRNQNRISESSNSFSSIHDLLENYNQNEVVIVLPIGYIRAALDYNGMNTIDFMGKDLSLSIYESSCSNIIKEDIKNYTNIYFIIKGGFTVTVRLS